MSSFYEAVLLEFSIQIEYKAKRGLIPPSLNDTLVQRIKQKLAYYLAHFKKQQDIYAPFGSFLSLATTKIKEEQVKMEIEIYEQKKTEMEVQEEKEVVYEVDDEFEFMSREENENTTYNNLRFYIKNESTILTENQLKYSEYFNERNKNTTKLISAKEMIAELDPQQEQKAFQFYNTLDKVVLKPFNNINVPQVSQNYKQINSEAIIIGLHLDSQRFKKTKLPYNKIRLDCDLIYVREYQFPFAQNIYTCNNCFYLTYDYETRNRLETLNNESQKQD